MADCAAPHIVDDGHHDDVPQEILDGSNYHCHSDTGVCHDHDHSKDHLHEQHCDEGTIVDEIPEHFDGGCDYAPGCGEISHESSPPVHCAAPRRSSRPRASVPRDFSYDNMCAPCPQRGPAQPQVIYKKVNRQVRVPVTVQQPFTVTRPGKVYNKCYYYKVPVTTMETRKGYKKVQGPSTRHTEYRAVRGSKCVTQQVTVPYYPGKPTNHGPSRDCDAASSVSSSDFGGHCAPPPRHHHNSCERPAKGGNFWRGIFGPGQQW